MAEQWTDGDFIPVGAQVNNLAAAAIMHVGVGTEAELQGGGLHAFHGLTADVWTEVGETFDAMYLTAVTLLDELARAVARRKLWTNLQPGSHCAGVGGATHIDSDDLPDHTARFEINAGLGSQGPIHVTSYRNQATGEQGAEVIVPDPENSKMYFILARERLSRYTGAIALGEEAVLIARAHHGETLLSADKLPGGVVRPKSRRSEVVAATISWSLVPGAGQVVKWKATTLQGKFSSLAPAFQQTAWPENTFSIARQHVKPVSNSFTRALEGIDRIVAGREARLSAPDPELR